MNMVAENTFVYSLIDGQETVYIGITSRLDERKDEHRNEGKVFDRMKTLLGPVTRAKADQEEDRQLKLYKKEHGRLPKYNETPYG